MDSTAHLFAFGGIDAGRAVWRRPAVQQTALFKFEMLTIVGGVS
jgi:hypothetical protein